MKRLRTIPSRWAAALCVVLAVLALARLAVSTSSIEVILQAILAAIAVATGVKMWLHNCFESHLGATIVATGAGAGALLGWTVGLPGVSGRADVSVVTVLMLGCAIAIPVLLVQDARVRRERERRRRRLYAR